MTLNLVNFGMSFSSFIYILKIKFIKLKIGRMRTERGGAQDT